MRSFRATGDAKLLPGGGWEPQMPLCLRDGELAVIAVRQHLFGAGKVVIRMTMTITALDMARRFIGCKELPGVASSYLVMAMLRLDMTWPQDDSVPWCSAFTNFVCWLLNLPRSKSLAAKSWLTVGWPVASLEAAEPGFDVVVLTRDGGGHVGFFVGYDAATVQVCGGNQHDEVNVSNYPLDRVLAIRRLWPPPPAGVPV